MLSFDRMKSVGFRPRQTLCSSVDKYSLKRLSSSLEVADYIDVFEQLKHGAASRHCSSLLHTGGSAGCWVMERQCCPQCCPRKSCLSVVNSCIQGAMNFANGVKA